MIFTSVSKDDTQQDQMILRIPLPLVHADCAGVQVSNGVGVKPELLYSGTDALS